VNSLSDTANRPSALVDSDHDTTSSRFIEREEEGFVSLCPEFDMASQGSSIEEARANLVEALSLFFETADPSEVARRFHSEIFVTQVEVPVG
jgi:predicted RNase H-like HicB family nuclease